MPPQRKCGGKILRDGFCVFTRITGLAFHSDVWTLISSFSKGRGSGFSDFGHFGLVLQRIRSGFSDFGLFTLVLHRYGSVFLDVGLVFLLDFGLSYNVFSFAVIKIEILSAFISFHRLLFNHLLGKLICI
jgi:hypothetical protein